MKNKIKNAVKNTLEGSFVKNMSQTTILLSMVHPWAKDCQRLDISISQNYI